MSYPQYIWDENNTNIGDISELLPNGYTIGAYPHSYEFNALMNNVTNRLANLENQGFQTGDIKATNNPTPLTGWINWVNGTIGNTGSGGTVLASPAAQELFNLLWANTTQGNCPVSSGSRGVSALADWTAGYTIDLPVTNGNTVVNLASTYSLGQTFGITTNHLSMSQLPASAPTITDNGHIHNFVAAGGIINEGGHDGGQNYPVYTNATDPFVTSLAYTGITINNLGSGVGVENRQPSTAVYMQIKL